MLKNRSISTLIESIKGNASALSPEASRIATAHKIKQLQEEQWHQQWVAKNRERQQTERFAVASPSHG